MITTFKDLKKTAPLIGGAILTFNRTINLISGGRIIAEGEAVEVERIQELGSPEGFDQNYECIGVTSAGRLFVFAPYMVKTVCSTGGSDSGDLVHDVQIDSSSEGRRAFVQYSRNLHPKKLMLLDPKRGKMVPVVVPVSSIKIGGVPLEEIMKTESGAKAPEYVGHTDPYGTDHLLPKPAEPTPGVVNSSVGTSPVEALSESTPILASFSTGDFDADAAKTASVVPLGTPVGKKGKKWKRQNPHTPVPQEGENSAPVQPTSDADGEGLTPDPQD